ncbi:MAG: MFS transporter [Dehalococcoidia bacterium]
MHGVRDVSHTNKRPRIFYGWYIVGASILLNSYLSLSIWQGFTIFFLPILSDFGVSRTLLSGAFSLRQIESGFMSPVVGLLVDRVGPRKVILVGVLIAGTGMVLVSLSPNIWVFYATFALMSAGVGGASHGVSWAVMVARWFRRKRGRATSLAFMGGAVGGPGVILVSILLEAVGWRTAVLGLGIGIWIIGIPLSLVARSRPQDYGYLPDGDSAAVNEPSETSEANGLKHPGETTQSRDFTLREAVRGRSFWALVGILGAQQISMGGLQAHQIAYFQDLGFSATQAASTLAIAFSVSAIGRFAAGILIDMMDWRFVLASIMIGQLAALLILANVTTFWHAVLFAVVLGLCHGMLVPARPIIAGTIFGTRGLGAIWGGIDGAVVATGVVGPVYLGWTFDTFGTYIPAFYILMAVLIAAIPTVFIAFKGDNK